jgi:hypothetical protein
VSRRPFPDHLRKLVSALDHHGYAADVRREARHYQIRWTSPNGRHGLVPICNAGNPTSVRQAEAAVRRFLRQDGAGNG